jgi:uncharacterized membrane protein
MVNLSVLLFLIVRIFSNPIANVLQKKLAEDISPTVINFYTYLLLSICYLPYISKYISPEYLTPELIILVLIAGLLCAFGNICLIKSLHTGEPIVLANINSYKSIVGLLLAFILLKESPSLYAIAGIFLVVIGSRFIFDRGISLKLLKRSDIQLRIMALLLTGAEVVILKRIIILSSVETCFIFWCFMGAFWTAVLMITSGKKFAVDFKSNMSLFILIAICVGFMQYSTNYVLENMNVACALALFQLSALITVFFGSKYFEEKHIIKKIIGTIIMITGSVIIILF